MKLTNFTLTSGLVACLTLTFAVGQVMAISSAELQKICDNRAKWCIRTEDNGHGIPFMQADQAPCSNYGEGIYAYRMCALEDHSVAHLSCNGNIMNVHFNGNDASLDGAVDSFFAIWGQNGPSSPTRHGKINLYAACK